MANVSYGTAFQAADYRSFGSEDDVLQRSSDEDLDDMVQRNIRDVLQQAGVVEDGAFVDSSQRHHDLSREESGQKLQRGSDARDSALQQTVGPESGSEASASGTVIATHNMRLGSKRHPVVEGQQTKQRTFLTGNGSGPVLRSQDSAAGPSGAATVAAVSAASRRSIEVPSKGPSGGNTALLDIPGQPEASLRLHKARIKALEDDVLDREKQLADSLRELKDLRSQAAGWARDKKALEGQLDRAKKQAAEAEFALKNTESTLKNAESQVRELAKADSRAERERRASEAEVRARDVRLQRALEEVERYKQLLSEVRAQEREVKGCAQQDVDRLMAENRKLQRQRAELITAFKKQLKLIEVLKRFKIHLEAARDIQFSEEEFKKTLEMGAA